MATSQESERRRWSRKYVKAHKVGVPVKSRWITIMESLQGSFIKTNNVTEMFIVQFISVQSLSSV